ncbi:MAG: hypothetical protein ACK57G_07425 [Planctomycetota bacterium]|jgi:hypothetical protein
MEEDVQKCKELVFEFANALNDWQCRAYVVNRIVNGQFVSDKKRASLTGYTWDRIVEEHFQLFSRFTRLDDSEWGTVPGKPVSFPNTGDFEGVDASQIAEANIVKGICEIVANWKYRSEDKVKFTLKNCDDRWLITRLSKWDDASAKWVRILL